jgi:hypothetical protein
MSFDKYQSGAPDRRKFDDSRSRSMPENIKSHTAWLNIIKTTGCIACHGIGTPGTRAIPAALGHFEPGTRSDPHGVDRNL